MTLFPPHCRQFFFLNDTSCVRLGNGPLQKVFDESVQGILVQSGIASMSAPGVADAGGLNAHFPLSCQLL
jgi:hypothetical protein